MPSGHNFLALNNPGLGGMIFGLPAGVLLLACWAWIMFYLVWVRPRRTITAFTFDGEVLSFQITAGWQSRHHGEIVGIAELRRRRSGGIGGWSLEFSDKGWAILPASMQNAAELIAQLQSPPIATAQPVPTRIARPASPNQDRGLSFAA